MLHILMNVLVKLKHTSYDSSGLNDISFLCVCVCVLVGGGYDVPLSSLSTAH